MGEDAKVAVRNLRREINEDIKKREKAKEISEDEKNEELEATQKAIDKAIKEITEIIAAKDKEILEV